MVVLAPVSSVSGNDLTKVHFSAVICCIRGAWSAAWCDHAASAEECTRRDALTDPGAALAAITHDE